MELVLLEKGNKKGGFENCGEIVSSSDFEIITWTHAKLPYLFLGQIFLQLVVLEKKHVKFGFGKMVSLTCFEIVAQPHARVLYSFSGLMIFYFE